MTLLSLKRALGPRIVPNRNQRSSALDELESAMLMVDGWELNTKAQFPGSICKFPVACTNFSPVQLMRIKGRLVDKRLLEILKSYKFFRSIRHKLSSEMIKFAERLSCLRVLGRAWGCILYGISETMLWPPIEKYVLKFKKFNRMQSINC